MNNKELIVIKIGSNVLTNDTGKLSHTSFKKIARQIKEFFKYDKKIVIVSSGAIACGTENLKIDHAMRTIPQKQAAASVGQGLLLNYYQKYLTPLKIGQILLTADGLKEKKRAGNVKNTIHELLKLKTIPVINENDSVVVDEIKFGDNDMLSAQVATLLKANRLIMLTDIDGLYDKNPKTNNTAKLITQIDKITPQILKLADGKGSQKSTGGMYSKLLAAKLAAKNKIDTYIANGFESEILKKIILGKARCTHFKSW